MGQDPLPSHMQYAVVPSPHSSLSSFRFANFVTVSTWGPHELRERVGRAEAQVASMLTESTVYAILLPNASEKELPSSCI